jgi:hypothetical protein
MKHACQVKANERCDGVYIFQVKIFNHALI